MHLVLAMASLLFRIGTLALLVAVVAPGNVSHWYARSEPRDQGWLLRRLCRCRLLYRPFFVTGATFFAVAPCALAAALCNRQRFFVAAMILAIPSLLIRRLVFGAFGVAGNVPLIAAVHWIKHFAPSPTHFRPSSIRTSSVAKPCSSLG